MVGALELAETMAVFVVVQIATVIAVRSRARSWRGGVREPAEIVPFSVRWRLVPFVGSAFWFLLFLLLAPWTPPIEAKDSAWMIVGVGCVLVPLWVVSVTTHGTVVRVDGDGIERRSPWGRRGAFSFVAWKELRGVQLDPARLEVAFSGARSRVTVPSAMVGGLIPAIRARAPAPVREMLEREMDAAARGRETSGSRLLDRIRRGR